MDFKIAWFLWLSKFSLLFSAAESQLLGYCTGVPGDPTSPGTRCAGLFRRGKGLSQLSCEGCACSLSEKVY